MAAMEIARLTRRGSGIALGVMGRFASGSERRGATTEGVFETRRSFSADRSTVTVALALGHGCHQGVVGRAHGSVESL